MENIFYIYDTIMEMQAKEGSSNSGVSLESCQNIVMNYHPQSGARIPVKERIKLPRTGWLIVSTTVRKGKNKRERQDET